MPVAWPKKLTSATLSLLLAQSTRSEKSRAGGLVQVGVALKVAIAASCTWPSTATVGVEGWIAGADDSVCAELWTTQGSVPGPVTVVRDDRVPRRAERAAVPLPMIRNDWRTGPVKATSPVARATAAFDVTHVTWSVMSKYGPLFWNWPSARQCTSKFRALGRQVNWVAGAAGCP